MTDTPRDPNKLCTETRHDGTPCQAWATTNGKCAGHNKLGAIANPVQAQAAATASRVTNARTRSMTFQDHIATELEKEAHNYVQTMKTAAANGDWRAYEAWTTRVLGKPTERVEHVDTSRSLADMSAGERAELRRRLVADNPELLELVPRGVTTSDGLVEPKTAAE